MRTLRAEYNGRACASIVREFESQGGSEPPERHHTEDHRAMYVLPPNVTCDNDGRLHSEHMYGNESRGFYLKDRQAKSQSYRIGLFSSTSRVRTRGSRRALRTCARPITRLLNYTLTTSMDRTWTEHFARWHMLWPGRLEVPSFPLLRGVRHIHV